MDLTVKQIVSRIFAEETVTIEFFGKAEYESARSSILRKFSKDKALFLSLGAADPWEGKFIQCRFVADTGIGTFRLEDDKRKSNIKGKVYRSVDAESL